MQLWALWALCLSALPGLLLAGPIFVEGDRDPSNICKPPAQLEDRWGGSHGDAAGEGGSGGSAQSQL
ncbi:hypothetical protein SKAU_G00303550, partial [Synaphobranchus kaupii]